MESRRYVPSHIPARRARWHLLKHRPESDGKVIAREEEKLKRPKVARPHSLAEALNYPLTPKP